MEQTEQYARDDYCKTSGGRRPVDFPTVRQKESSREFLTNCCAQPNARPKPDEEYRKAGIDPAIQIDIYARLMKRKVMSEDEVKNTLASDQDQ